MTCKCQPIPRKNEKKIMTKVFIAFIIIQTLFLIGLCIYTIIYIQNANVSWFLEVDVVTLLIALVFLSLILLIIGISSARSNASFSWALFHPFLFILLIILLVISWFTSNVTQTISSAQNTWKKASEQDIIEMQTDMQCCGFLNTSDRNASKCPEKENIICCKDQLTIYLNSIRNAASISLFVDFVLAMFIDFLGCAICFHPDVITLEQQIQEENMIMDQISSDSNFLMEGNGKISQSSYGPL